MWKTASRIAALMVAAIVMSLGWTGSGQTATCLVDRGQNPLDVVNIAVRHNVWVALDNSGSMSSTPEGQCIKSSDTTRDCVLTGPSPDTPPNCNLSDPDCWSPSYSGRNEDHPASRLAISKSVLTELITDPAMNDDTGQPLVNWGFVYTEQQEDDLGTTGSYSCAATQYLEPGSNLTSPFGSGNGFDSDGLATECVGLDPDKTEPSLCTDTTSKNVVLAKLKLSTETTFVPGVGNVDGIRNNGGTVNSVSMAQTAQLIANNHMASLKPGQKNFIIYVSDGAEDCECENNTITLPSSFQGASSLAPGLRYDGADPTLTKSVSSDARRRFFNAGIKGRFSLETIDPSLDGSLGDIFVVFFGENGGNSNDNANHWAWESSGYGWTSRPR